MTLKRIIDLLCRPLSLWPCAAARARATRPYAICLLLSLWLYPAALIAAEQPDVRPIRIGLTAVFLDDQVAFTNWWRDYLERRLGRPVKFVQRSSYREIIDMLRQEKLEFAWLCGYPYVQHRTRMRLTAVPLFRGKPLYQSYLIVPAADTQTRSLFDLRGKIFAYSDPDSNSGYLYPQYLLLQQGVQPADFFVKSFFTWSHRKVVEAVAVGLAQGGAVDSYVWETLARTYPDLTAKTRVVNKSPEFGHPPFIAGTAATEQEVATMRQTLLAMAADVEGARLLLRLNLDGFVRGDDSLFAPISRMAQLVEKKRNAPD